jgi:hypothetical protein
MYPSLIIFNVSHDLDEHTLFKLLHYKQQHKTQYLIITDHPTEVPLFFDFVIDKQLQVPLQNFDPYFTIYFDDHPDRVLHVKNTIFWSYCYYNLDTDFDRIVADYHNAMLMIKILLDVSEDRYLSYGEAQQFLHFIEVTDYTLKLVPHQKICYDHKFIKYVIDVINATHTDVHIPYDKIMSSDTLNLITDYFDIVDAYDHVYSLGDSLDKLNFLYNVTHPNHITTVPFSGSMYNNIDDNIELDPDLELEMVSKIDSLLLHNKPFATLYDHIKQGATVLITDYGHSGKALITIVKLFNMLGITDWSGVTYLQITTDPDIIERNVNVHLQNEQRPNIIYKEAYPDFYFTNSDRDFGGYYSRCVPRYEVNNWIDEVDNVWIHGEVPNYRLCNIHRKLFLLQLCSRFKN